jgi:phosphate transport system substrate-binding protein
MNGLRAACLAALSFFCSAAAAQDVTLTSRDGAIELTGTLLGFDGQYYRVDTRYGELTIDGTGVNCAGVGCPSLTDYVAELTVSGSATMGTVLMPALVEAFALREGLASSRETLGPTEVRYTLSARGTGKPVGRFTFKVSSTDEGFADLLADEADIVMAVREIRPREVALAREAGLGDLTLANRSLVVALDAIVPIVSPVNPVDAVSLNDLARILAGDLTNWRELGGPDAPVVVHLRDRDSGVAQGLQDRLRRPVEAELPESALRHGSNERLARAVARDPFGIGMASFSEIGNTKPLVLTGPCGFQLRAARRTIKTEDYPLTAPMFLYLPARRLPALGRDFMAFAASDIAQIVIRRAGFVDQASEEVPVDLQGDRFANAIRMTEDAADLAELRRMTEVLADMRRLTTSFRFEPGSARLDAQSRSNVRALARAFEEGVYDGRSLIFVGFSDGDGPADANLEIARKRADAVRAAVLEAAVTADRDRIEIRSEAFGEAMPMACDDTAWGRQVNRRVEVWLR